ncbi:MAG: sigma 54-interacting transcriptional regulator [Desulfuromonadaceae bacterium]|nr:sigma 54-interacting transcriptional regulator [Desulfuromonadaceae bacterium]
MKRVLVDTEMETAIVPSDTEFFSGKFARLERLFEQVPFGISVFDRQLQVTHANDRMAAIIGEPAERCLGSAVRSVDPAIALALEPLLRSSIAENRSFVQKEIIVPFSDNNASHNRCWLACCHPLKAEDGSVAGCGLIVQDITERKKKEGVQVELLKFEALLSDLSATFINVQVSEVDGKIVRGLQQIVEFLGFDRSSVWRVDPDNGNMVCTHTYALAGIVQPPTILLPKAMPIWNAMVLRDEIFKVSDVDELSDDFVQEKNYCREHGGIRSIMFIPASVGGVVAGFITFVSYRVKRDWHDDLIQRLRLLWEVYANALERKRADQKIQSALAEIEKLKDRLEAENIYLRDQISIEHQYDEIIGKSYAVRKVLLQVEQVATTDSTVLILGETGTGKELIARAIHNQSMRRGRAMIKVNCAALPAALVESELFGHEKGAYTGAVSNQIGRFEAADGGTLFLDEIGELPLEQQTKLLRVLQEGQLERLGSPRPINVDVRVIAATNRNLAQAVKEGHFREDLYYRLNVFPISIPPLRERREDIPLLVWGLVDEFCKIFGKTIERISKKNMETLEQYSWPGNIRELRNMVERAMILSTGTVLIIDVPESYSSEIAQSMSLEDVERRHIISVMESTGWRVRGRNGAAEILTLKPTTLDSMMKKLGIARKKAGSEI